MNHRLAACCCVLFLLAAGSPARGLPLPKEGLLFSKEKADEVRRKVRALEDHEVFSGRQGIRTVADAVVAEWPKVKAEVQGHVPQMLDLLDEGNPKGVVPDGARQAAAKLGRMFDALAKLGFMYFLTGRQQYADTAYEILEMAGRVPRWGWFNWDGANMPQIHYGQYTRTAAFCLDFCWSGWDKARQQRAARILAEKGVQSYWRIVSITPFMGLHHLRSKNQGNNALAAALIASIAVGDSVPENKVWFDSLLQTYCWIIAHDIGWAGTNLESGVSGYWSVSMQNLYTAAACLYHARGIDLRVHPGFAEATWYPILHEATVPPSPHARFDKPYPKDEAGLWGIMEHKPIELPSGGQASAWWYDYAANFPDSPAPYFISKDFGGRIGNAHQRGHAELLELLWVRTMPAPATVRRPAMLFKATDREAMFRSGYGSPHTFLSFNGDMFLSARNEVLCCTGGLAWHFPWHQYAVTESVLETEGEPFSPSMLITDSFDGGLAGAVATKSWTSNVKYFQRYGQRIAHLAYKTRTRDVVYVRSDDRDRVYDYFLFIDHVKHDGKKWHSFNWHLWSQPGNEGKYEILDGRTVLARRPNAAVLLAMLSHDRMTCEQQAIPSQPTVAYVFDHNALLLRAIAGPSQPPGAKPVTLPARLWSGARPVKLDGKEAALVESPQGKKPGFRAPLALEAGCRYRVELSTRKEDARIYENFAWIVNLKLLDKAGQVLVDASAAESERDPHPLRLTDPASNEATYADWKQTATHFTAPPGVASVEATFLPATWGHATSLKPASRIWLGEMLFTPLGAPVRTEEETIVTLAVPLENDGPRPRVEASRSGGSVDARLTHPDGTRDRLVVGPEGALVLTRDGQGARQAFGWKTTRLDLGGTRSTAPLSLALREQEGRLSGNLVVAEKAEITLGGKTFTPEAGAYRYDGRLHPDPEAVSLAVNPAQSQRRLKAGLSKVAGEILRQRDRYTSQGWKNIAPDAVDVQATGTRDPRFAPRNVVDNKTWEIPIDGVVDYTVGPIETTQGFGYGRMEDMSYHENRSQWPFYFRPTYWLLPPRQLGEITIQLRKPVRLKMVRLLNTTNAGLNDFAAVECRVTLLSEKKFPRWTGKVTFGRARDGAFAAAFARPEFFSSYGAAFDGMLEPGAVVPFGAGWVDVPVACDQEIAYVRVKVKTFWAMGGGLNEVQIYPADGAK